MGLRSARADLCGTMAVLAPTPISVIRVDQLDGGPQRILAFAVNFEISHPFEAGVHRGTLNRGAVPLHS